MGTDDSGENSHARPVVDTGGEPVDTDEVLTKSTSDVYHIKNPDKQFQRSSDEPACSVNNHKVGPDGYEPRPIERVLDEGKKHCTSCVRWVKRTTDVEIHKCQVCERISIANDNVYLPLDVEEYPNSDDEVKVCSDCISKLHRNVADIIDS